MLRGLTALGSFSSSLPAVALPSPSPSLSLVWLPLDITVSLLPSPLAASLAPSPFPLPLLTAVCSFGTWFMTSSNAGPPDIMAEEQLSMQQVQGIRAVPFPPSNLPPFHSFPCFIWHRLCRGEKPIKCTLYSLPLPWLLNSPRTL